MKNIRTDTIFYYIGLLIAIPALAVGSWFAISGYQQIGDVFACKFMKICHFPCPGCGGTRAVYYFFSGQIFKSFMYHPCVIVGVIEYFLFMITYIMRNYICKKELVKEIEISYYMYIFIGVILLQWIIKIIYYFY